MQVNVHGAVYDGVRVSENGIFSVTVDGEAFESDSLAGLRNKILYGLHQRNIEVAVPFTIVRDGLVRHGVAVGIARDDSVLVRWDHNPAQTDYLIDWHHTIVTRLGEEEAEAYQGLLAAQWAATLAVGQFELERKVNLKQEVASAIAAALEKDGGKR